MKIISLTLLCFILIFGCKAQDSVSIQEYKVGETIILVQEQYFYPVDTGIVFIHLHDNEFTSYQVAQTFLQANGGKFLHVINGCERIVESVWGNNSYCFDPNRIYSKPGIEATVLNWTGFSNPKITHDLSCFSNHFLNKYIDAKNLIVSLHNNTDTNYSIVQIQEAIKKKKYFGKVYINPLMDVDDFVLTTDEEVYNKVANLDINVIWENADSLEDDGSLSVYAGRRNIPYINIEAQHDHAKEQSEILQALQPIIKEFAKQPW